MLKFLLPFVLLTTGSLLADDCDNILKVDLRNHYSFEERQSLRESLISFVESRRKSSSSQHPAGGFSITLPIDGLPVTFGGEASNPSLETLETYLNSGSKFESAADIARSVAISLLDPIVASKAIDAWVACKSGKKSLVSLEVFKGKGEALLIATYHPVDLAEKPPVIRNFQIINGEQVGSDFWPGQPISRTRTTKIRYRPGASITVILETTKGVASLKFEANEKNSASAQFYLVSGNVASQELPLIGLGSVGGAHLVKIDGVPDDAEITRIISFGPSNSPLHQADPLDAGKEFRYGVFKHVRNFVRIEGSSKGVPQGNDPTRKFPIKVEVEYMLPE